MTQPPDAPRRAASTGTPEGGNPGGGSARRAAGERSFGSAAGWTVLGTIIPGLGLWQAGRRVAGGILMGLFALVIGGGAYLVLTQRKQLMSLAIQPNALEGLAIGLAVIALGYVALIAVTHLALRPSRPSTAQRVAGAGLVGLLSFLVAAPMAVGSTYAWTTASVVNNVFAPEEPSSGETSAAAPVDPWADKPRVNFLIIGGDSGNDRASSLGDRTDTVIVASVDTHTGATTLFTLPRNTARMPFPSDSPLTKYYPNGFYDGVNPANAEYFLNAMYRNVPNRVPHDALGKTKDFGAEVLKAATGEALGLDVEYYVKVNMDGFKDFVNAIGGVTLNVNYRIPIGGQTDAHILPDDYIEPGPDQHMNGRLALWYARGRYGLDDYKRMERQRCVINAVVQQTTPITVLQNYQSIAAAGQKTITTDVPRSLLPDLMGVAEKVKGTKLRSIVFTPDNGFTSANPDWSKVRAKVKKALKETASGVEASATPTASASASAAPTGTAAATPTASGTATKSPTASATSKPKSEDLDDVCGYHPEK